ncbi:MAG: sn-glycerol-3-phosphate ABC transporter substrate-binding protein UgpB [Gemmatimonadaceae bacterium]|nr:sn-glycerol-3-phosphate ABC transporter substrate-binding protein UgpB [Acetobacteraceae bacterium]
MKRRTLLAGASALGLVSQAPAYAQATGRTRVVFWHALSGVLGEEVNRTCAAFNASQTETEIVPVFKGTYAETLTGAIAAWRAGQAPHLVQMFEVGTGSMLAAGPAVKPTWQLIEETGVAIDPAAYIGAVKGYYSLPDGRLASMPFNSSTAVMWLNADAFEKAGLDASKPPATWPEVIAAAQAIKAKSAAETPVTTSWFAWIQLEQFAAMHNVPFATKANGFEGLDTELRLNTAPFVKQLTRIMDMAKEGTFRYAGRDNAPDPVFVSGQAGIGFMSSGSRGDIAKNAKFKWVEAPLPYDPELTTTPINSVIGGASLWTMTAPNRTPAEFKGVAQFLAYIAQPKVDAEWHQRTGYVPVTLGGYEESKRQGFYEKNAGADVPIQQLTRGTVTENSKGFRLGRMPEIRNIVYEEVERALQGQQTAQAALDSVVTRGNRVLREFERANKT